MCVKLFLARLCFIFFRAIHSLALVMPSCECGATSPPSQITPRTKNETTAAARSHTTYLRLHCCHLQKSVSEMRLHFLCPTSRRVKKKSIQKTSAQQICHDATLRRAPAPSHSLHTVLPLRMSSAVGGVNATSRATMANDATSDPLRCCKTMSCPDLNIEWLTDTELTRERT